MNKRYTHQDENGTNYIIGTGTVDGESQNIRVLGGPVDALAAYEDAAEKKELREMKQTWFWIGCAACWVVQVTVSIILGRLI